MTRLRISGAAVSCLLALVTAVAAPPRAARAEVDDATREAIKNAGVPIMMVDDVRIGMKGYGLTVFHGTKIEAFPVEVVSVMNDFAPRHSVVWILCGDPRLKVTGPVAGMSGSPIYLWDEGKDGEIGKGGKLIGAFAFGFRAIKDCYAGVQPIESMLGVAVRSTTNGSTTQPAARAASGSGQSPLIAMLKAAEANNVSDDFTWKAKMLAEALKTPHGDELKLATAAGSALPQGPTGIDGKVVDMRMPVAVRTKEEAAFLGPMLEPLGMMPMAVPIGTVAGRPPKEYDPKLMKLEPGSIISLPLAYGDADLSAAGTVTHVMPDGRVLAFGHAMFGEGKSAFPMATGYVHYIVPGLISSFKLAGSGAIQGAVIEDENSAIVGTPSGKFVVAPVTVKVNLPNQPSRTYHYNVAHHKELTPALLGFVLSESLTAETNPPADNTMVIKSTMKFENGKEIKSTSTIPQGGAMSLMFDAVGPVALLASNQHKSVMLDSMECEVNVEPVMRSATIINGRLDSALVAPGDTVKINVKLQPFEKEPFVKRIEFPIPASLDDGDYRIVVTDARNYLQAMMAVRPHLRETQNVDDLAAFAQMIVGARNDALYVVMNLPTEGLALGRTELPQLPSSKRALIATPITTAVSAFGDLSQKVVPIDYVPTGRLEFTISVRKDLLKK